MTSGSTTKNVPALRPRLAASPERRSVTQGRRRGRDSRRSAGRPTARTLAAFALLCALVLGVSHGAILNNELINDDAKLLDAHALLANPDFWREIPFRDYGLELGDPVLIGYYRPVFVSALWAERQLFANAIVGYRVVSLLTALLACFTLASLLWHFTRNAPLAGTAALLFACTPAKTEQVGQVSCWPDLVLSFGPALLLWAVLESRKTKHGLARLAGVAFGASLSISLTKEIGIAVCAAVTLSALAVQQRPRGRGLVVAALGLAGVVCALGARAAAALGGPHGSAALAAFFRPLSPSRSPVAWWTVTEIALRSLSPMPARYLKYFPGPANVPEWVSAFAMLALALVCLAALGVLLVKRRPFLTGVVAWCLAANYAALIAVDANLPFCDRYVCMGPTCILLALAGQWVVRRIPASAPPEAARGLVWLWLIAGSAACYFGTRRAVNQESFWRLAHETSPDEPRATVSLANILFDEGSVAEAVALSKAAIARDPREPLYGLLGNRLGGDATRRGALSEALDWFHFSLERQPNDSVALTGQAVALARLKDYSAAQRSALAAERIVPEDPTLAQVMARIWIESPNIPLPEAVARVRKAKALGVVLPDTFLDPQVISEVRRELAADAPH